MRGSYELTFEVDQLSQEAELALDREFDLLVATHGRTTALTMLVAGRDPVDAAASAVSALHRFGVRALRPVDDLVTRAEIAERAGVTAQAVGMWVRGERNSATFPEPYVRAGTATLWLWGEVVAYLRAIGTDIDDSIRFPSREDVLSIAGMLAPTGKPSIIATG